MSDLEKELGYILNDATLDKVGTLNGFPKMPVRKQTKKYLIDTYCDHEGENFGFIVQLSKDQAAKVQQLADRDEEGWVEFKETDLTEYEVKIVNSFTDGYMPRLNFRNPPTDKYLDDALANTDEYFVPFYKGDGLENT